MILVMVSFTLMAVLALNQHVVLSIEQAIGQLCFQRVHGPQDIAGRAFHPQFLVVDAFGFPSFGDSAELGIF